MTQQTHLPSGETTEARDAGSTEAIPLYFGAEDRPLFGWLHRPVAGWSGVRVVVCPPLGYEGLFAHPSLRHLALSLAEDGAAVLRFDYDGTADSAGSDRDPDRVEAWSRSIEAAIAEINRLAPSDGPTVLVGLRAGCLLASYTAEKLGGVDALVLWAPTIRGKAWVREQRAFAKMAVATAPTGKQSGSAPSDGIEAYGYFFSDETIAELGRMDLREITGPPATRTLILWRDDIAEGREPLAAWTDRSDVAVAEATGYAQMMEPPISMSLPLEATGTIGRFVDELGADLPSTSPPTQSTRDAALVGPGVVEQAVWYDDGGDLFGILTRPEEGTASAALVLLNNARGYRVGPHGMNPPLARRLAAKGVATLRLDLAGVGDSSLPPGRSEHHVYGLDAVADVQEAVRYLKESGIERVLVGGLCSGAYLAWHAAPEIPGCGGLVMLNLQTFEWTEELSLDVSPLDLQYESDHYRESMTSASSWLKLLRGGVDVGRVVRVMSRFLGYKLHAFAQRVRTALPLPGTGSATADRIQQLHDSGATVAFVFADRDPGLTMLRQELGGAWRGLVGNGQMRVDLVEGSDHSFTPSWASRQLYEIVEDTLVD